MIKELIFLIGFLLVVFYTFYVQKQIRNLGKTKAWTSPKFNRQVIFSLISIVLAAYTYLYFNPSVRDIGTATFIIISIAFLINIEIIKVEKTYIELQSIFGLKHKKINYNEIKSVKEWKKSGVIGAGAFYISNINLETRNGKVRINTGSYGPAIHDGLFYFLRKKSK